jgi:hypothetical protein
VRDSNQRLIKEMTLTQEARATGPQTWSGRTSPSFEVTMEPELAYYFVLAGRVAVTGTEQSGASARLEATSLQIRLTPQPGAAASDTAPPQEQTTVPAESASQNSQPGR